MFNLIGRKGEFKNNSWWWRPLWSYVCDESESILNEEQKEGGQFNNGIKVTKTQAIKIADKLDALIKSGETKKYEDDYEKKRNELSLVECNYCEGTGKRHDEYVDGKCNACFGTGKVKDRRAHYPFSADNVKNFSSFTRNSEGFEIW